MMDKMLLHKAIEEMENYSSSKKQILGLLLNLKALQKDEIIIKNPSSPNSFKFNIPNLEKIESSYRKKLAMMEK